MGIFKGNESLRTKNGKPLAPIVRSVISDRGSIQGLSRNEAIKLADLIQKQPVPLQEYLNAEHGFAIDVPIGWAIRPESDATSQKPSVTLQWEKGQRTFSIESPGSVVVWENSDKSAGILIAVNERKVKSLDEVVHKAKDADRRSQGGFKLLKSIKEGRDRVWMWMNHPGSHVHEVSLTMLTETHEFSITSVVRSEVEYKQQSKTIEYSTVTFRIQQKQ